MKTLGIDIGSSSVKASLLDTVSGECVASFTSPSSEMAIDSLQEGWAEQDPQVWWENVSVCLKELFRDGSSSPQEVAAIGITYQMHGLVALDSANVPLRKSIIWCDSRAVEIGREAFEAIGPEKCLERLLNSPGNFTASKMAWVKRNEPQLFAKATTFILPGDYIAYKLSGEISTTDSGLSEQILWDFQDNEPAYFVAEYFGIDEKLIPSYKPSIGIQAYTSCECEAEFGIKSGTPISYRAGDQPNNAFSLNVMEPGEVAATGGTSGVVYGVTQRRVPDKQSRINTFLHINHSLSAPRYGVLLCINGTGIMNAWIRRLAAADFSYAEINGLCCSVPVGSEGVIVLPFGNGSERMLGNRSTGAAISGLDLNRHSRAHVLRAVQEGIAFAFRYGLDIMKGAGIDTGVIRAGYANMFLSPVFTQTLASVTGSTIELYNTDGALGAARGAALGAGIYKNREEAFRALSVVKRIESDPAMKSALEENYILWKNELKNRLEN